MTTFYEEQRGSLLWVTETGLSDKGRAVIGEVRKADDWGLHSSDSPVPQLPATNLSPRLLPKRKPNLLCTALKYARYARGGRIVIRRVSPSCWTTRHPFARPSSFLPTSQPRTRPTPTCARYIPSTSSSRNYASCF